MMIQRQHRHMLPLGREVVQDYHRQQYEFFNVNKQRRHARDDRQRRSAIANGFFNIFANCLRFSWVRGRVWIRLDLFGCVRMRSDAFGCARKRSDSFGKFRFVYRFLQSVSMIASVFERFWVIWDAGRVCAIYRRSPRTPKISEMCALKPFSCCWLVACLL